MRTLIIILALSAGDGGCKKFLDAPPDKGLTVPDSVESLQSLLDNDLMNSNVTPGLPAVGTDDLHLSDDTWQNMQSSDPDARNAYTWERNIFSDKSSLAWNNPYLAIYYANTVIKSVDDLLPGNIEKRDSYQAVKAQALFKRSILFLSLQEAFGKPYRPLTAATDVSIILRTDPTPDQHLPRANVAAVFQRIITDLQAAIPFLPANIRTVVRYRPSRPAAYALLARTFLIMQDYSKARLYADSCLQLYNALTDYNDVSTALTRPFSADGIDEILYQCSAVSYPTQYLSTTAVDSALFASYEQQDLRRTLLFRYSNVYGTWSFRGQYTGKVYLFTGLANDEVYLIRAECNARMGRTDLARSDLDYLLDRRYRKGVSHPYPAASADEVLVRILQERRKELPFREIRWSDLRRLNSDPRFAVTLQRTIHGTVYSLSPDDPRYALPIPQDEIDLSGIPQNPR